MAIIRVFFTLSVTISYHQRLMKVNEVNGIVFYFIILWPFWWLNESDRMNTKLAIGC